MKILTGITLPELLPSPKVNMRLKTLLMEIAHKHRVSVYDMRTDTQTWHLVAARADFAKRAIEFSKPTEIAEEINKDRTSIYYYLNDYTSCDN